MNNSNPRSNSSRPLTIFSLNVGRGAQSHEISLNEAHSISADIILIQEPYIFHDLTRRITKKHPSYDTFSPAADWSNSRPRVISYTRKGVGIQSEQKHTGISNDLLLLSLSSSDSQSIKILNIYNAPSSSPGPSSLLSLFELSPSLFSGNCLILGDFNLHHHWWQPSWPRSPSPGADSFVDWIDTHNFSLLSPEDIPTHNRGNVLDLAFGKGPLLLNSICNIPTHIDLISDHLPLLTIVPWKRFAIPFQRLRLNTLDINLFKQLLASSITSLPTLPVNPTPQALDKYTERLIALIREAYTGAAKRAQCHGKGSPWWNQICKSAKQYYKQCARASLSENELKIELKIYRKILKREKKAFFRSKIENARTAKDMFSATKWHKSVGKYRSIPLKNPSFPENPPATALIEKCKILADCLLSNRAELGDIHMDAPTVAQKSLPFLPLTLDETKRAILNIRNSTPGSDEIPTGILRLAWPLIESYVHSLFVSCLSIGHHPTCFRKATVIILQKPNKTDYHHHAPTDLLFSSQFLVRVWNAL